MQVEDKTRRIFISVVIGDSDFLQNKFINYCDFIFKDSYRFEWKERDIKELKEKDSYFRKLVKNAKIANRIKNDYINLNN